MNNFTQQNNIQKLVKYILIGLIVILATRFIPDTIIPDKELLMIGATASITFGIIDMISPSMNVFSNQRPNKCSKF
jgi:hypothetical protein